MALLDPEARADHLLSFGHDPLHVPGRKGQTLGLGGHILQWSGIRQWMDVVRQHVDAPDSTNEDMTDVGKWVPVMEALLLTRLGRSGATG